MVPTIDQPILPLVVVSVTKSAKQIMWYNRIIIKNSLVCSIIKSLGFTNMRYPLRIIVATHV
jgi:hypothetical protein